MAAIIAQIKRDARAHLRVQGIDAVELTESTIGSKVQLRGWPMGIRGHIDGHHNARLNNHVALVAKYYCPDAGSGSQCRVLQLLATPHSTKRSVACSPDDADNARKRWIPESAGPLAQRASAGQPIAWTYSLSWVPDAVSPPQQRGERTMARLQTSSAATAPAPRAVALEPPVAAEVQSSSEGRASPVLRHAVVKGRGQGNTEATQSQSHDSTKAVVELPSDTQLKAPQGTVIPLSYVIAVIVALANVIIFGRMWRQAHEVQQSRQRR
uniref:Uncharacterized protein n=1 Tax=Eutreptiella gymnastica TaxID=73025 RepID=A0A7S4G9H4_9EUGL